MTLSPAPFTSWIGPISIFAACIPSPRNRLFSSSGPNPISIIPTFIPSCRQGHRSQERSDHCTCGTENSLDVPRLSSTDILFRFREPKTLVFLTNNFVLPPLTIAQLYRCRWQVELFFKWIKQHLRIKAFLWDLRECYKNSNLDCHQYLRAGGHPKKGTAAGTKPKRNLANFKHYAFREKPD